MSPPSSDRTGSRRVLLAGATGLVGGHLLRGLLADESVTEVHVVGRRQLVRQHLKLSLHVVDFATLPSLPVVDEVYLALGTTMKNAGSREAFWAVDYAANLAVVEAGLKAGARRVGLVSAMGADARSKVFYNRVKGELEQAVLELAAGAVVIARPSLLLGDRQSLDQTQRPGEELAKFVMGALGFLLPKAVRPVQAAKVARALLTRVPQETGPIILSSAELQGF